MKNARDRERRRALTSRNSRRLGHAVALEPRETAAPRVVGDLFTVAGTVVGVEGVRPEFGDDGRRHRPRLAGAAANARLEAGHDGQEPPGQDEALQEEEDGEPVDELSDQADGRDQEHRDPGQEDEREEAEGPLEITLRIGAPTEGGAFAQFAGDLDKATRDQLNRGEKLSEIVKQPQYQPLPVEKQVAVIFAATNGYLDAIPVEKVREYEESLYRFLDSHRPGALAAIKEKKVLDDDVKAQLKAALEEFGKQFGAAGRAA